MPLGPFDLAGGPFLALYILLLAAASLAAIVIPKRMRPDGRRQAVKDVDQLAFLAGGWQRFNEALVTRLLASGKLVLENGKQFVVATDPIPDSPAERRLLALPQPFGWREIGQALRSCRDPIERQMTGAGLLIGEAEIGRIRFWAVLPLVLLIAFGAIKWIVGEMRDRPTGFLTLLLILTFGLAVLRWFTVDRRTRAAQDALIEASLKSSRLRRAPTRPEMDMAVALFGTTVLAGSAWGDFHQLRRPSDGDGSIGSSCGSGGDGGGGGGGGGCGGCSS